MSDGPAPIAIIGMSALFPGAPDLAHYWEALRTGADGIEEVPPERWDPVYYDPSSQAVDRFYCRRGGFVHQAVRFDALAHGVMPVAAKGAEPDQLISLGLASDALADAGYLERDFDRTKAAVILGRGNYIGAGMTRLEQHVRTAEQLVRSLRDLLPQLGEGELAKVKQAFQQQLGGYGPDTAIGLVPNLTASRVANRLDLAGPAYTVDAACASSLVAVDHAVRQLREGSVELALAGGIHLSHDVAFWSVFTQLGALSRAGCIRPFDRRADGLLIGEGAGVVVLKRLDHALRDGDRVYALINGVGVASDGRHSLMTPRPAGQQLALQRAWQQAGLDPAEVGLIEAHGTATPAGDRAELDTLRAFFGGPAAGDGPRAGLGSVKSQIGHTMPAAGIAGLIKAALSLHHRFQPASLHCEEPHPLVEETRFSVLTEGRRWPRGLPQVAGVNAFGFGGINAHVVLSGHRPARRGASVRPIATPERLLVLAAEDRAGLLAQLDGEAVPAAQQGGDWRVALVDPSPRRLAQVRALVEKGTPWRGRDGVWFSPRGLLRPDPSTGLRGAVGFMFPGVEADQRLRVAEVAAALGVSAPLGEVATDGAPDLEHQGAALVGAGQLWARALARLGLEPAHVCGHSVGEWTAMVSSGAIPEQELSRLLGEMDPGTLDVPEGVVFAAAGSGVAKVRPLIEDLEDLSISHDNCPHQIILCGRESQMAVALERLRGARVMARQLPFRSGFHSPLFAGFLAPHQERLRSMRLEPARLPLWSGTSAAPMPADTAEIASLAVRHLVEPVRFREVVEGMHAAGVRVFLQLGPGSLVGFVADTLKGQPHLAESLSVPQRSGLNQLSRVAAALFVEGADLDLSPLGNRIRRGLTPARGLPLPLSVPLVRLEEQLPPLVGTSRPEAPVGVSDPLAARFQSSVDEALAAQREVLALLSGGRSRARTAAPPPPPRALSGPVRLVRRLSVETCPELLDHSFFRQAPNWPVIDRYPVVPLTMQIHLMMEAVAEHTGRTVVGLRSLRAFKWIAVEPAVDAELVLTPGRTPDEVRCSFTGYAEATLLLGARYREPPRALDALTEAAPCSLTARALYEERWMFHGPAYQGVVELGAMGPGGLDGVLETGAAPGALLDNAGQLLGLWVMLRTDVDRLAMPVLVERIDFFGPHPRPGTRLRCAVRIRRLGSRTVVADIELAEASSGRQIVRLSGWQDLRFDTDARLFAVMCHAEHNQIAAPLDDGAVHWLADPQRSERSRDYLRRRYLTESERARVEALPAEQQHARVTALVAAKDAVRVRLLAQTGPLFPAQIELPGLLEAGADGAVVSRVLLAGAGTEHVDSAELWASIVWSGPHVAASAAFGGPLGLALAPAGADPAELAALARRRARQPGAPVTVYQPEGWVLVATRSVPEARGDEIDE